MIEILKKEVSAGTLEQHAKGPFLGLLKNLLKVLKTNGLIVMNHYMFQLDLDWGYPQELFENIIHMTRKWLDELEGCKEVFYEGFSDRWWIFLKKV